MNKMDVYNRLPIWGQNLACFAEGMRIRKTRYGKTFWQALDEYESHNGWSYEQLCDYRDERLRKMIRHCYDTVPYYTKLFKDGGIDPDSIRTLDDLKVLPILTKQEVNRHPEDFLSSAVPRNKLVTGHTSGTTGSGFVFKTTQQAVCEQWAVWWRYRRRLGIEYDMLCGGFGGRSVVPVNINEPPYYRWNWPNHVMYFSTYHISEATLPSYIEALKKHDIEWIHGYPSAINLVAEYMCALKMELPMRYVTMGAENLLDSQREHISAAFHVQAYQHYGLSEAVANFSEDCGHTMYVDEDFAAVEFLPTEDSDHYEVVGTNLTNYAMPLLRYETKDICGVTETAEGRVVTSLDGRLEDYVVLPNGAKVGRLDHIFKDLVSIREAQIFQNSADRIEVRVVRGQGYSEADEGRLKEELALRLTGIQIDIAYVDTIQRTSAGKLRFVISEVR